METQDKHRAIPSGESIHSERSEKNLSRCQKISQSEKGDDYGILMFV